MTEDLAVSESDCKSKYQEKYQEIKGSDQKDQNAMKPLEYQKGKLEVVVLLFTHFSIW